MVEKTQSAFSRGEVGPDIYGRIGAEAFQVAVRIAENWIVRSSGGIINRPGLEFIAPVKDHSTTPRQIRFQFKKQDTYHLEFGDLYMRVIRNGSQVTETPIAITGATQADPVVVSAVNSYSDGDHVFISDVAGMTELNNRWFIVANPTAGDFEIQDQLFGGDVDGLGYGAWTSGGTTAKIYEIVTPYVIADVMDLQFEQTADTMTIVHPSYDPRELTRSDHDSWTLPVAVFGPSQDHPVGMTVTQDGTPAAATISYRVTALADTTLEESLTALNSTSKTITSTSATNPIVVTAAAHGLSNGEEGEINGVAVMTEINGRRFKAANKTANTFELEGEDGTSYAAGTGGTVNKTFVTITDGVDPLTVTDHVDIAWTKVSGAQRYAVYKRENGLYGLLGETELTSYVDDGSNSPDLSSSPPAPRNPFLGVDNFPGAVGKFEQRRVFGGSNSLPDTSDYSRVGDFGNFSFSTPAREDDAIRATLTSGEVDIIRHYVGLDDLLVLTSGGEWRVHSGTNRFSAGNIFQKEQTRWGASKLLPAVVGRVILFVTDTLTEVRSIGFNWTVDGYTGTDMTLLASHLFSKDEAGRANLTARSMAYGRSIEPLIYIVRSDGQVVVLTFHEQQEVIAWTRWKTRTPDKFENVVALRTQNDGVDEDPYFIVQRTIHGRTVRYIERARSRRFADLKDSYFVDCGSTFDNPVVISTVGIGNPIILTTETPHEISVGNEVDISDIEWVPNISDNGTEMRPDQLNGGRFVARAVTATTIALEDLEGDTINGVGFNAYVGGGNVRRVVTSLSGYYHLRGATVSALLDGSVSHDLVISDLGILTLPHGASRAHVGLMYNSDLELLDITVPGAQTIEAVDKNVHRVMVNVAESRGLWAGPNEDKLVETPARQFERYGEPIELFTGKIPIVLQPEWNSNGRIFLRQRDPLPLTIASITPRFDVENESE